MGKTKLIFWVIVVAVLLAFTFFIFHKDRRNSSTVEKFPDGSTFRLVRVEFTNGNHSYSGTAVTGWRAKVAGILPNNIVSRLGWSRYGGSITLGSAAMGTNLGAFTDHVEQFNAKFDNLRLVVFDELGNSFDAGGEMGTLGSSDGTNMFKINGWCPPAFPRRGKWIGLRYYQQDVTNAPCLAEFIVPNPAFASYPVWTAEALPLTKTNGPLSITLESLKSGLSEKDRTRPASSNEVAVTEAAFRIAEPGRETNAWRPVQAEISDATGNHWTLFPYMYSTWQKDGLDYLSFKGALWPGEAAWKMRFEFSRIADFDSDEVCTFSGITVPGKTQVISLDNGTNIGPVFLKLKAITGEKAEQPGYLKWSTQKNSVNISISASTLKDCRLTLVKVTDDTGQEATIVKQPVWPTPERVYAFKRLKGAKELNLTFALHKSRYVEFTAKPQDVRTN